MNVGRLLQVVKISSAISPQAMRVKFSALVRETGYARKRRLVFLYSRQFRSLSNIRRVHSRTVNDSRACQWSVIRESAIDAGRKLYPRAHRELMKNRNRIGIGCFHAAAPGGKKETSGAAPPCKSCWKTGRQPGAAQTSSHAVLLTDTSVEKRSCHCYPKVLGLNWVMLIVRGGDAAASFASLLNSCALWQSHTLTRARASEISGNAEIAKWPEKLGRSMTHHTLLFAYFHNELLNKLFYF